MFRKFYWEPYPQRKWGLHIIIGWPPCIWLSCRVAKILKIFQTIVTTSQKNNNKKHMVLNVLWKLYRGCCAQTKLPNALTGKNQTQQNSSKNNIKLIHGDFTSAHQQMT